MGTWNWQLAVALLVVAAAVLLLVRRAVRLLTGSGRVNCADGHCSHCPSQSAEGASKPLPLVPLTTGNSGDRPRTHRESNDERQRLKP